MLTIKQQDYFNEILNDILIDLTITIPIFPYNHETLTGKHKEALGLAWGEEGKGIYQITIDEYFIEECYNDKLWNNGIRGDNIVPKIAYQSLEEVIFHEISHITYRRHSKKHTELKNRLYKSYLNRKGVS